LLDELEKFEKGSGDMNISAGLVDPEDIFLSEWNCSILGPQGTAFDEHFYELRVTCSEKYPVAPPKVRFVLKINIQCVNQANNNNEFASIHFIRFL
jgi:ubiquitin-protein ligase